MAIVRVLLWAQSLFLNEGTLISNSLSGNLRKRKTGTSQIRYEKNKIHVINDTDENVVPANADKTDVINQCKRQLFDVTTYKAEMESFFIKKY